jgi:hypothetical protein
MSIRSIHFQVNVYDRSGSEPGDVDRQKSFISAIKSPPPALSRRGDDQPSPKGGQRSFGQSSFQEYSALAVSDPNSSTGDDDVDPNSSTGNGDLDPNSPTFFKDLDTGDAASSKPIEAFVSGDSSPDGSGPSPDSSGPKSPDDYLSTLQNGNATGNPPDDLTLPPGTTAADVANMNGGLLNNLNQGDSSHNLGAGDAAAQKYGYEDASRRPISRGCCGGRQDPVGCAGLQQFDRSGRRPAAA